MFGCLAIYNATFHHNASFHYVARQAVWLLVALAVLAGATKVPAAKWEQVAVPLTCLCLTALYAVLAVGVIHNGMRGWFAVSLPGVGPFETIYIQPSELAKPVFALFLARLCLLRNDDTAPTWRHFGLCIALAVPWFLAIALQPDFGTLLVYIGTFVVVYWLRGGPPRHLVATAAILLPLAALIVSRVPYIQSRLKGFLDPTAHSQGSGWHIIQYKLTLASGGLTGQPVEDALWARNYLPLGHTDSVFATVGETLGLLGLIPILAGLGVWFAYGFYHSRRCDNLAAATTIGAITCLIGIQALIHISVTVGLLPPTGVTLPFLSYGGSSLVSSCLAIGILQSFIGAIEHQGEMVLSEDAVAEPVGLDDDLDRDSQ
jgi:cell division protein FtsW